MARPESVLGRQIRSRGAVRSERERRLRRRRRTRSAFRPHRRESSVDVEPITKRQAGELAEFDGLFIRETTSIDNHTYRFARRAAGRHAGDRRSDLDDPLHQQSLPDGAVAGQSGADAADGDPRRGHRPDQGDRRARPAAGGEDPRWLVFRAACTRSSRRWRSSASARSCSRRPTSCWRRNSCRPISTGGSACWPASRCSSANTAWRAAIGRWRNIAPTVDPTKAASAPSISPRRRTT